jgi:hypothetical protein
LQRFVPGAPSGHLQKTLSAGAQTRWTSGGSSCPPGSPAAHAPTALATARAAPSHQSPIEAARIVVLPRSLDGVTGSRSGSRAV